MGQTARTTISVPLDLKARMDAAGEPVNWSAVACRAFELKLAEIDSKRKVRSMKDVIRRLRATKQASDDEVQQQGREDGRQWAMKQATAAELGRLAALYDACRDGSDWDQVFDRNVPSAYGPGERFVFTIRPDVAGDREAAKEFWRVALGDHYEDEEFTEGYVQAFAEGALEVWDEVKDQL